jgi:hypothetical protein
MWSARQKLSVGTVGLIRDLVVRLLVPAAQAARLSTLFLEMSLQAALAARHPQTVLSVVRAITTQEAAAVQPQQTLAEAAAAELDTV